MPKRPLKPCAHPGCPALVSGDRCELHQKKAKADHDATRQSSYARGYDSRWGKIRLIKLNRDPLCEHCGSPAVLVHHSDENPRNNVLDNLVSLCNACHEAVHGPSRWGNRR